MARHSWLWLAAVGVAASALATASWGASRGGRSDLSTGVVYPSDNSALFENPGALPQSATTIEGLMGLESDLTAEASLVGNARRLGWGLGANYLSSSNKTVFGGLGVGGGELGLGITGRYNLDAKSFDADAGLQVGGRSGLGLAVVARGLSGGPSVYVGGVGYRQAGRYQLEGDVIYVPISGGDDRIDLSAGLGVHVTSSFSLMAGYSLPIQPSGGEGDIRAGAALWLGGRVAVEYLYQFTLAEHTVGLKFAL